MIYAVGLPGWGEVKIGCTENVNRRLGQLRAKHADVELITQFDGMFAEEKTIHRRFAHLRVGRTEWFRKSPDLMAFLADPRFEVDPSIGPREKPGPKPDPARVKGSVFQLRGRAEWMAWLAEYAESRELDRADLIETALAASATACGFKPPPKR